MYLALWSTTAWTFTAWNPFRQTYMSGFVMGAMIGIKVPSTAPMTFWQASFLHKPDFGVQQPATCGKAAITVVILFLNKKYIAANLVLSIGMYNIRLTDHLFRHQIIQVCMH